MMHRMLAATQRYSTPVATYNPTLAAGEVAEVYLCADGRLVEDNIYTSDFSSGSGVLVPANVTLAGNIDGIAGEDNCLRLTVNAADVPHWAVLGGLTAGALYYATYRYYVPSGQSNVDGVRLGNASNTGLGSTPQNTVDAWTTVRHVFIAGDASLLFIALDGAATSYQDAAGDDVCYFKDIVVTKIVSPLNCIRIALNTNDGHLHVFKRVAGVETELIDEAINYGDGKEILTVCRRSGANLLLDVFYDDAVDGWKQVGTTQTISDAAIVAGKYHYASGDGSGTFAVRRRAEKAEQASGTCTAGSKYRITATEGDHFFAGCAVNDHFVSDGTETLDANNKVREVLLP